MDYNVFIYFMPILFESTGRELMIAFASISSQFVEFDRHMFQ